MIFEQIKGHQTILKNLKNALKSNSPAHALLFSGPSGVGKKLTALAWAQGLLCENKNQAPCQKCSSCSRVARRQHPDLMMINPGDSATLKIEQVRDIQNFVSLKAFEGHAKVVIIDEAQTMTAQAANALLKTLEEPPHSSYFILVTSNKAAILPTIQSRCQKVLFGSLSREDLKSILPDAEDWALELAQGRVDAAQRISDETYKKWRASALKVFKDLPRSRTFEGFMSLEPLSGERDSALFAVQCWAQWVKTASALKLGARAPLTPDEKPVVESLVASISPEGLLAMGQKILRLEQDIQANINKSLAFEKFWIDARKLAQNLEENP